MGSLLRLAALAVAIALLRVSSAAAADSCAGATLTSADALPHIESSSTDLLGDDFDLRGPGCIIGSVNGDDRIVCLRVQMGCFVNLHCDTGSSDVVGHVLPVASCGALTGSTACFASRGANGGAAVDVLLPLTAGVFYCLVCDTAATSNDFLDLELTTPDDCGLLPVELQGVEVER